MTPWRSRSPPKRSSRSFSRSQLLSRSRSPSDKTNEYRGRSGYDRTNAKSPSLSGGRGRSYSGTPPRRSPTRRSAKVVIEKLTKNVQESHLREIFGAYGRVREVDLPMNRQCMSPSRHCGKHLLTCPVYTNRGTAFILYEEMDEAEAAIAHMHEAQIDGAVINVSIVLPRRKFSRSPPPSRRLQAHIDRYNDRGPPYPRGPPPQPPSRYRSPPRRGPSPPRRHIRSTRDALDTYRPRSLSRTRSRSPRRAYSPPPRRRSFSRSPSFSRSMSRSPPLRRASYRRRDSVTPPPRRGGGGNRRRSPSYDSFDGRDRSLSRERRRRRYS